jgi:hypothetical protein
MDTVFANLVLSGMIAISSNRMATAKKTVSPLYIPVAVLRRYEIREGHV